MPLQCHYSNCNVFCNGVVVSCAEVSAAVDEAMRSARTAKSLRAKADE